MSGGLDHVRLLAEIEAEVRERRRSGDLPADFEQRLNTLFARLAPVDSVEIDLDRLLDRVDQSAFIDVVAPAMGSPAAALVKKAVRKAIIWQLRHVAQQVSAFGHAVSRALRILVEREDALERALAGGIGTSPASSADALSRFDVDYWAPIVAEALVGARGRVLHVEAESGDLVARLVAAGTDAYGVEPDDEVALIAGQRGLDVRADDVMTHLRSLPSSALGGLVFTGCVDRLLPGVLLDLAEVAADKLMPAGKLVVVSSEPAAWAQGQSLNADLSPGRPVQATTWQWMLSRNGLVSSSVHTGPAREGLTVVGDPVMDANVARLNALLFAPASYAVIANRPS